MIDILIGAAAGFAGGYVLKGQTSKSESQSANGIAYSSLYNEAQNKLNKVNAELRVRDEEIAELNLRIKSLTRKLRDYEDKTDDKTDEIDNMKRTIELLRRENEELTEKVNDYKSLYTAAQQEIERLKA